MTSKITSSTGNSSERIYKSAAKLFAQKGYEGTSIRDIASAVGLSVSTVNYHVGGKEALYREILMRTYDMERKLFAPLIESAEDVIFQDRESVRNLIRQVIDVFINRILYEPETYRLWTFHFLEESDMLVEMDREFSLPFYQMMLDLLQRARQAGIVQKDDEFLKMFIVSVSWMLHGYFNGRKNNWGDPAYDPFLDSNIRDLHNFLYQYVDRMLDFPVAA